MSHRCPEGKGPFRAWAVVKWVFTEDSREMAQRYETEEQAIEAFTQACFHLSTYTPSFRHSSETAGMAADFGLPENYDLKAYLIIGSEKCKKDDTTKDTTGILPRIYTASSSRRYRRRP